jgi:nucleoside-diphosphate kinase
MISNRTFTMIKPEAVSDGHSGEIISMIEKAGFKIIGMKMTQLSLEKAAKFYEVHEGRPFYKALCEHMSSGPIIAMIIEKDNAIEDFRTLIGATDPNEAAEGTIRRRFAKSTKMNAVHGSDSDENAEMESKFFFSSVEIFSGNHYFENVKTHH